VPFTQSGIYLTIPGMRLHPFNGIRACDILENRCTAPANRHIPMTETPLQPETSLLPECRLEEEPQLLPPLALLEAALFLAKEPMTCRKLSQLAGLPERTRTRQLIQKLNQRYEQHRSAFCVVEVAEGFQLRTRPELAAWLVRMQGSSQSVRLSNPAMETLTVIAYRQPVPRTEIERIRGVQCGDLIRQLLEQDLATIVGRSEELGRPFLYGTTSHFLKIFGLANLNDLPTLTPDIL